LQKNHRNVHTFCNGVDERPDPFAVVGLLVDSAGRRADGRTPQGSAEKLFFGGEGRGPIAPILVHDYIQPAKEKGAGEFEPRIIYYSRKRAGASLPSQEQPHLAVINEFRFSFLFCEKTKKMANKKSVRKFCVSAPPKHLQSGFL
jgi:hypothetical protein